MELESFFLFKVRAIQNHEAEGAKIYGPLRGLLYAFFFPKNRRPPIQSNRFHSPPDLRGTVFHSLSIKCGCELLLICGSNSLKWGFCEWRIRSVLKRVLSISKSPRCQA
uniref:Uncharacterized protein n=1 Tax=Cucumis sativus TaxID=3659 RepID=A0A0A0KWU1_CUCSA